MNALFTTRTCVTQPV